MDREKNTITDLGFTPRQNQACFECVVTLRYNHFTRDPRCPACMLATKPHVLYVGKRAETDRLFVQSDERTIFFPQNE